jgi:adenosylhomocysteine nucleosidase
MQILLIAPLQAEFDHLVQSLHQRGFASHEQAAGRLTAAAFPALDLLVARGGHGKTQFGIQTQHLLDCCDPHIAGVICVGAAGALAEGLAVGDVVVATNTVEHDYNLKFVQRPLPRFPGHDAMLTQIQTLFRSPGALSFRVHFGTIASGDEDVIAHERAAELRRLTDALAVAWEGAGGARASPFSRVPFVEMRGLTDTANHDAPADFDVNLGVAMENIATCVGQWRTNAPPSPRQ